MNQFNLSAAMTRTLEDLLRPREVGERVTSHVLEEAKQPAPDFDAMRRVLSDRTPSAPDSAQPNENDTEPR
jgi:hypothetical protein